MGLFTNPLSYTGYPPGVTGTPTTQPSAVRAATAAEAAAGTLTDVYISPATADSSVALDFASPPVDGFGSSTRRPVFASTLSSLGATTLNTSGSAATTIGTGGTGTVAIGNATGNTAVTGSLTASTGLIASAGGITATGTSEINISGAAVTTIGTGGTGAVNIGNATGNTTVTGSLTASTTLTATSGNITATNGNFVSSAAGKGLSFNATTATGVAASPIVLNTRAGSAVFTSVSIAAGADLTLTITNSEVTASTTQVLYSMSGVTSGAALSIKSVTNSAGSSAVVVTNGTGATTTTADITLTFVVVN